MIKECSNCIYYEPKCKSITFRITNGICTYHGTSKDVAIDTCGYWGEHCEWFKPKNIESKK